MYVYKKVELRVCIIQPSIFTLKYNYVLLYSVGDDVVAKECDVASSMSGQERFVGKHTHQYSVTCCTVHAHAYTINCYQCLYIILYYIIC